MEELANDIKKKYFEDITTRYPLHRLVILLIMLFASYCYDSEFGFKTKLLEYANSTKISFLYDTEAGMLSKVSVMQLFLSVVAVVIIQLSYGFTKKHAFSILVEAAKPKIESYVDDMKNKILEARDTNESVNFYASKDVAIQLENRRRKLKSYHSFSEVILSIAGVFLMGVRGFGLAEYAIVLILFTLIAVTQWKAFEYYIEAFVPLYVAEKILLGMPVKFGED